MEGSDTEYPVYQPGIALFTKLAAAATMALGLLWKWRDPLRYGFHSFVLAEICFTMASPLAWEQHYGVLLPGFMLAYIALLARPGPMASASAMLLAGTYVVCGNLLNPLNATAGTPLNIFQSYLLLGALCLIAQLIGGPAAHLRLATHQRSSGPAPTGT